MAFCGLWFQFRWIFVLIYLLRREWREWKREMKNVHQTRPELSTEPDQTLWTSFNAHWIWNIHSQMFGKLTRGTAAKSYDVGNKWKYEKFQEFLKHTYDMTCQPTMTEHVNEARKLAEFITRSDPMWCSSPRVYLRFHLFLFHFQMLTFII